MSFECPHFFDGKCRRRKGKDCKPGSRYCILEGRFEFPAAGHEKKVNELKSIFPSNKKTNNS
ncbi:MAG: hypothetical protein GXX85_15850 [Ignavibacteria bacterium]|nr:hypothetical protein [Ignavibacteria bacterium]